MAAKTQAKTTATRQPSNQAVAKPRKRHKAARKATRITKGRQALALRCDGYTYVEIARELGYANKGNVCRLITEELECIGKLTAADAERLRAEELAKLQNLEKITMERVKLGDIKAAGLMLRIGERRSKLLGLDAAIKHELAGPKGGPITTSSVSDAELLASIAADAAAALDGKGNE